MFGLVRVDIYMPRSRIRAVGYFYPEALMAARAGLKAARGREGELFLQELVALLRGDDESPREKEMLA